MLARRAGIKRMAGKPKPIERKSMEAFAAETLRIRKAAAGMKSALARKLAMQEAAERKKLLGQWKKDIKRS